MKRLFAVAAVTLAVGVPSSGVAAAGSGWVGTHPATSAIGTIGFDRRDLTRLPAAAPAAVAAALADRTGRSAASGSADPSAGLSEGAGAAVPAVASGHGSGSAPARQVSYPPATHLVADDTTRLSTSSARPVPTAALRDQRTLPDQADGQPALVRAVGPHGEVLEEVGRADRNRADGNPELRPGRLDVVRPDTGARVTIRPQAQSRAGTQTAFVAFDARYVVWTEQTSTTLDSSDWTLYGTNRATGATIELAKARPVDAKGSTPTVPGFTVPSIADGKVYWAEARPNPKPGALPVVDVFSRELPGANPGRTTTDPAPFPANPDSTPPDRAPIRTVVRNAVLPVATGRYLYYVDFDAAQPNAPTYTVNRLSLATGARTIVDQGAGGLPDSLAAEGSTVAWSLPGGYVRVFQGARHVADIGARSQHLGQLSVGNGLVGFGDDADGGNYLFETRTRRLYDLGTAPGLSEVLVTGRTVRWAMPSSTGADAHQSWRQATFG